MAIVSRWLRRLRVLRQRTRVERELDEELRLHVEMEAEELQRTEGLSPREARRRALLAFGGMERHREAGLAVRGIFWLESMSLDVRLAGRMLRKHAALSVVGGLGMAVAIAIGAGFFTFSTSFYYAHPPLDEGGRIVALENRDLRNDDDWRSTPFDFQTWRREVRSVRELSAFRRLWRNLAVPGGVAERVQVAEMTASGFGVARVAPLLGRPLLEADEEIGAPPVVVIGHREWQRVFAGDPAVVGRRLRLGATSHEVVGVMPEGFRFPLNHGYWVAMPTEPSLYGPGEGPKVFVFGRLGDGVGQDGAQQELAAIGARLSADLPAVYEHLRPEIVRYGHALLDLQQYPSWVVWLMQLFAALLLTVVAVNVAVLVYARTAARSGEITVRMALGAGRSRIVGQLFIESLVLCGLAAALGLAIAHAGYRELATLAGFETLLPYWIADGLSPATVLYGFALAVFAAFVIGVLPALQSTGPRMQAVLRELGGGSGLRMGGVWTVLIVVQVAVAVAALPAVIGIASRTLWRPMPVATFPADEVLTLWLARDDDVRRTDLDASFPDRHAELVRRVRAEPGVAGVAYTWPTAEESVFVEVEGAASPGVRARASAVDPGYFDVLGVPLLAGRNFVESDAGGAARSIIVSRALGRQLFGDADPLGRRVRKLTDVGTETTARPWLEVVGVVEDLYAGSGRQDRSEPGVLHYAATPDAGTRLLVRTHGTAGTDLAARIRRHALDVAPDRQAHLAPMVNPGLDSRSARFVMLIVGLITLSVLLLSAAGVSALTSFAVTRRRREIGIRTALGASRGRLITSIFARSLWQLGLGLAVGIVASGALDQLTGGELLGGRAVLLLALVAALMVGAGLLAALGPARRALRVHPMEALRQE